MADDPNAAGCFTGDESPLPVTDAAALVLESLSALLPGSGVPFDPSKPQLDGVITSNEIYKINNLPGGTEKAMDAHPEATDILAFLQPMMTAISTIMMVLGPVKLVIDIIIAIINVICAIPNPIKIAQAMIPLFAALFKLASLFPAAAALLIIIQVAKTIILILGGIILVVLPKLLEIGENVALIAEAVELPSAQNAAFQKICGIVQDILNDLAILSPIQAIISLISSFAGGGIANICGIPTGGSEDAECCDDCPQIVRNSPAGRLIITPPNSGSDTFDVTFSTARFSANLFGAAELASVGSEIPMYRSIEELLLSPSPIPSADEPLGSVLFDLQKFSPRGFTAALDIDLNPQSIRQIPSTKTVEITFAAPHRLSAGNSLLIMRSPADGRFDGEFKVSRIVSSTVIAIVDDRPFEGLTSQAAETFAAGITSVMRQFPLQSVRLDGLPGQTRTVVATLANRELCTLPPVSSGDSCNYFLIPREEVCQELVNAFTTGCLSSVAASRSEFETRLRQPNSPYTGDITDLLGTPIPDISGFADDLRESIRSLLINPRADPLTTFVPKVQAEIDVWKDILERALCVSVDPVNSTFSVSNQTVDISGASKATVSFQPRSIGPDGGQPSLVGLPSNISVQCLFTTTHGELSETVFDPATGTYSAELSAKTAGIADLRAYFVTNDVCATAEQDGPTRGFPPKVLQVRFVDGSLRPRRQDRQYLPSAGGRRR